jgi:hypothetical protein
MQNRAFNEAANAGANNLQAHGMAKEATLTGAVRNLFKLLQNGVDPNRGGGTTCLGKRPARRSGSHVIRHGLPRRPFHSGSE